MPMMNGIEAAKRIKQKLPKTKIIILSMYSHEHYIHELMETGSQATSSKTSAAVISSMPFTPP